MHEKAGDKLMLLLAVWYKLRLSIRFVYDTLRKKRVGCMTNLYASLKILGNSISHGWGQLYVGVLKKLYDFTKNRNSNTLLNKVKFKG